MPTINDILPHPLYPGVTLAASNWGVFVIVNDEAGEWLLWSDLPTGVLSADPTATIFHAAKLHGGLWATTDFARTWSRVDRGIQNLFVGAFAGIPIGTESVLFAGTDFGIHHTAPTGWVQVLEPNQTVFDIERHPTQPMTMFMGTETGGVWKSTDAGQTWNAWHGHCATPGPCDFRDGRWHDGARRNSSGVRQPRQGRHVGLDQCGMLSIGRRRRPIRFEIRSHTWRIGRTGYRTGDAGRTFFAASNGLPAENIVSLEIAAWSTVYAVTETGSLYSSWDEGTSWQPTAIAVPDPIRAVKVDPDTPWILYGGTHGGGIWKTESAGIEWAQRNEGLGSPFVFSLAIDPRDPRVVYAGLLTACIARSMARRHGRSRMLPSGAVTSLVLDANPTRRCLGCRRRRVSVDDSRARDARQIARPGGLRRCPSVGTPAVFTRHVAARHLRQQQSRRQLVREQRRHESLRARSCDRPEHTGDDTRDRSAAACSEHQHRELFVQHRPARRQHPQAGNRSTAAAEHLCGDIRVGVTRDGGATGRPAKAPFVHVRGRPAIHSLPMRALGVNALKTIDGGQTSRASTPTAAFAVRAGSQGGVLREPGTIGVFSSSNGGATGRRFRTARWRRRWCVAGDRRQRALRGHDGRGVLSRSPAPRGSPEQRVARRSCRTSW